MEWTDDFTINFINVYEQHPVLWDVTNSFYKLKSKKVEAWDSISQQLDVDVAELKKKMCSLMATYRKVRQKILDPGKSGFGAEEVNSPNWFAYKAFAFLHDRYRPRKTIDTEEGFKDLEQGSMVSEVTTDEVKNEEADRPQTPSDKTTYDYTQNRNKIVFSSPRKMKRKLSASPEYPRIEEPYTCLQTTLPKTRDEFDSFGEYIAGLLRKMDKRTCAYVKKEFSETIFKAETGCFMERKASSSNSSSLSDLSNTYHPPAPRD